jgi:hypothetical protein
MLENRIMQDSYQFYNHENVGGNLAEYMSPQIIEFEDMHYIERKR